MISYRLLPAAAGLLLLAACGDKAEPQEGSLQGEVLEGTISDAMVPVDQVKSQAPLAGGSGEESSEEANSPAGVRTSDQAAEVDAEQPTPTPAETPEAGSGEAE